MNKKSIIFFSLITLVVLSGAAYQYFNAFEADFAKAYTSGKPANGHLWAEMECSQGLCVTSGNNVGIGTDSPAQKLEVVGIIKGTDVCSSGICLSQVAVLYSANPLYNSTHTIGNCATAGGTVIANPDGSGLPICQFANTAGTSCPTTATSNGTGIWTMYKNWSMTTVKTCGDTVCCCGCLSSHTTGSHLWSNTAIESTTAYNNMCLDEGCGFSGYACIANVIQIGCY